MAEIAKRLPDITIASQKSFVPFKRIQKQLASGEIDIFFGMAKNEMRQKLFTFSKLPIYEVNHIMACKKTDSVTAINFSDIRKLGDKGVILTNFGSATARYLRKQKGLLIDAGGKSVEANIRKLLVDRGRFVYFHDIGLISTINNRLPQKKQFIKILPISFRKYHHYIAFSKNINPQILAQFNKVLLELSQDGTLTKLSSKYNKF